MDTRSQVAAFTSTCPWASSLPTHQSRRSSPGCHYHLPANDSLPRLICLRLTSTRSFSSLTCNSLSLSSGYSQRACPSPLPQAPSWDTLAPDSPFFLASQTLRQVLPRTSRPSFSQGSWDSPCCSSGHIQVTAADLPFSSKP